MSNINISQLDQIDKREIVNALNKHVENLLVLIKNSNGGQEAMEYALNLVFTGRALGLISNDDTFKAEEKLQVIFALNEKLKFVKNRLALSSQLDDDYGDIAWKHITKHLEELINKLK